eukprot:TRINITY_DN10843_c1_g1_i1.p2 TRINITY_DN10843_c1_g1~~TRINITY_DN10843_c1_g1_i1.p2  ORF type:complete len:123 (-),score=14.48 TRINITY_DN10843_c1_g1_i1:62-430(-)
MGCAQSILKGPSKNDISQGQQTAFFEDSAVQSVRILDKDSNNLQDEGYAKTATTSKPPYNKGNTTGNTEFLDQIPGNTRTGLEASSEQTMDSSEAVGQGVGAGSRRDQRPPVRRQPFGKNRY